MKNLFLFAISASFLASCSLTEHYMADDIYVVKPSELAVGESTADETSYAAFKERKTGRSNDRQVFASNSMMNNGMLMTPWFIMNGYDYFLYTSQFPYWHSNVHWSPTGQFFWTSPTHNNYYLGNPNYFNSLVWNGNSMGYNYSNYIYGNCMYGSTCQPGLYYGGCSNNAYGYGGNGFIAGNYSAQNVYSGPRGSASGYANPNGRKYTSVLKSSGVNQPYSSQTGRSRYQLANNPNSRVEKRPINTIPSRQANQRYTTSNSVNRNRTYVSPKPNRAYIRSDASKRPNNTTYRPQSGTSTTGRNTTSNGSRSNSGSTIQTTGRSGGNANSGSSGSSGSSRSGGSTGGNTSGRRK